MNNKVDDKWLKDLREHMENYSEPLPQGLWEELDGELNMPKVIPFWRRWPSIAAAVAAILIVNALVLSYWFTPYFKEKDMQLAEQLVIDNVETDLPKLAKDEVVIDNEVSQNVQNVKSVQLLAQTKTVSEASLPKSSVVAAKGDTGNSQLKQEEQSESKVSANEVDPIGFEETSIEGAQQETSTEDPNQHGAYTYSSSTRARTVADAGYSIKRKKNRSNEGVELGIHTGGIPYSSSKAFDGMSRMASLQEIALKSPIIVMGNVNSKMTPYNRVLFSNRDKKTSTDVKHRMPINVVASVKWHFSEDWALESGVSYTFLQSELHSGSDLFWEDTQKLHYVGIPLKIHRNIWGNSTVAFYASVGGMIEKCVSGSIESVYETGNSAREVENHSVHTHPFQWSVSAAVGGQVNLINSLSLFVEPGIAYYFDDNSQLETIRKEYPCTFNLQFGLRFNLNN